MQIIQHPSPEDVSRVGNVLQFNICQDHGPPLIFTTEDSYRVLAAGCTQAGRGVAVWGSSYLPSREQRRLFVEWIPTPHLFLARTIPGKREHRRDMSRTYGWGACWFSPRVFNSGLSHLPRVTFLPSAKTIDVELEYNLPSFPTVERSSSLPVQLAFGPERRNHGHIPETVAEIQR